MMLQQSQQHRYDDLLLRLKVFAETGFVRWSNDEQIKHDTLQCWKRYNISRQTLSSVTHMKSYVRIKG